MKKLQKCPKWIVAKRLRKAAKHKGGRTVKAHASRLFKISK